MSTKTREKVADVKAGDVVTLVYHSGDVYCTAPVSFVNRKQNRFSVVGLVGLRIWLAIDTMENGGHQLIACTPTGEELATWAEVSERSDICYLAGIALNDINTLTLSQLRRIRAILEETPDGT
jgi:hypothetical protein